MSDEQEAPPYGGVEQTILPEWDTLPIPAGTTLYQRNMLLIVSNRMRRLNQEKPPATRHIVAVYGTTTGQIYMQIAFLESAQRIDRYLLIQDNGYNAGFDHSGTFERNAREGNYTTIDTSGLGLLTREEMITARDSYLGRERPLIDHPEAAPRRPRRIVPRDRDQNKLF